MEGRPVAKRQWRCESSVYDCVVEERTLSKIDRVNEPTQGSTCHASLWVELSRGIQSFFAASDVYPLSCMSEIRLPPVLPGSTNATIST